jgi:hypothetical protein
MIGTFIRDLFDRRAQTRKGQPVLDVLKIAIPSVLGGIAPIAGPLSTLLDHVPGTARIVRLLIPVSLLTICVIVVRTVRPLAASPGFSAAGTTSRLEYGFSHETRNAAKIAFPLILILILFEAWDGAPNWLLGRKAITGYLCQSDGRPVDRSATVIALDSAGESVSLEPASVDDNGYVVISYRPWARQASKFQLTDLVCGKREVALQDDARGYGCRRDPLRPPERTERSIWIAPCTK